MPKIRTFLRITRDYGFEPAVHSAIRDVARPSIRQITLRYRFGFSNDPDDIRPVWAPVSGILLDENFPFDPTREPDCFGEAKGPWDKMVKPFDQNIVYRSLKQRFVDSSRWDETDVYRRAIEKVTSGESAWNGCVSIDDVETRCDEIENLFYDIKSSGYQPNQTISSHDIDGIALPDHIFLAVDRTGRLIRIDNCRHRLSICKILGIEQIPGVILLEHTQNEKQFAEWDFPHEINP